jgi:rod shape determining protein RodA
LKNQQNKLIDKIDWTLVLLLFLFFIVSSVSIYSAQTDNQYGANFVKSQAMWYIIGAGVIGFSLLFDPSQYRKLSWILYGFGIMLLLGLIVLPHCQQGCIVAERNGAASWYQIPKLGLIQPSEFMKIFLILTLSNIIASHHEKNTIKTAKTDFYLLLKIGIASLLPIGLVLHNDLGTSLVMMAIASGLILISGITWKIIVPLYASVISIGGTILYLVVFAPDLLKKYLGVKAYQFSRIYIWLDPSIDPEGDGYHLIRAMTAIGSGEITGKGFLGKEVYLPERHTDFVFSIVAEEFGFVGASVVICLFFVLIYHLTKTALQTKDPFNSYVCAGIICMIAFHVFENIGMSIQVLPITGIPLPFISYGGSSLMGNMLAIGLIFSIRFYHREYMFSSDN